MQREVISETIFLSSSTVSSDPIRPEFFGANFLLGRDSLSGTYDEKVKDMGAALIRYPGGGIAENIFDITSPDLVPISRNGSYDTLSEFLAYCEANDLTPSIVIPTKKYIGDVDQGITELTTFIQRLTNGDFGYAENAIIEIGNEFYVGGPEYDALSASEYGKISSEFLLAIDAAASHDLAVGIQVGRNTSENTAIMDHYDTQAEIDAIDILVYHDYTWAQDAIEDRNVKKFAMLDQWISRGVVADIFISEWNVGSNNDSSQNGEHDYGLPQASAMIEFVSEATKYGVDFASVWGVQQNNKTSLYEDEGNLKINFGGQTFKMLSESLIGKQALDLPVDQFFDGQMDVWAFDSNSETVVFLSPNDFDNANIYFDMTIDLSGFGGEYSYVWAERLSSVGDPNDWNSTATVEFFAPDILGENNSIVDISFNNDFEVVKLVFEKQDAGENPMYIVGMDSPDNLSGGFGNDKILGYGGNDRIDSGFGDDYVDAGSGSDVIFDASGNDQILAGDGNDEVIVLMGKNQIDGGEGSDFLVGGIQGDTINGGSGSDVIQGDAGSGIFGGADVIAGGAGDDIMMGGRGADEFVFAPDDGADVIASFNVADIMYDTVSGYSVNAAGMDFQVGVDHILLDGFSTVNSSNVMDFVNNSDQGAIFSAEGTDINIYGVDASSLTVDDFLFL